MPSWMRRQSAAFPQRDGHGLQCRRLQRHPAAFEPAAAAAAMASSGMLARAVG